MDIGIRKAVDLVCQYTVEPIVRQCKYACCYKTLISDMHKAGHDLEKDKKIIEQSVGEAANNLQVITDKAEEWLQEVDEAHKEVTTLSNTYEQDQALKCSCFGQILNPIARHQHGRKATKKKLAIEELRQKKPTREEICYAPPPSGIVTAETAAAAAARRTENGVYESSCWNEAFNKIMEALRDDSTNIVGLHGMGGVGKTTMINKVRHQVFEQRLFNEVAVAKVSKDPKILEIQEQIAEELGLKLEGTSPIPRANRLRERLLKKNDEEKEEKKKKKTVLIILDDLWEKLELQDVGIVLGNDQVQIKLLLTSRQGNMLSDRMGVDHNIHLEVLGEKEAWEMFCSVVGETKVQSIKRETSTEIAKRCGGLPLAIMAIANALKKKDLKAWEETLEYLDPMDVLKNLEESYKHLPNDDASKDLFLLCGITRGPRILQSDLLKYTLGLQVYNWSTLIDGVTNFKRLLSRLEEASMLVKSDDARYVIIHDLMRELAVKIVDRDRKQWMHDKALRGADRCNRSKALELKLLLSYGEGDSVQVPASFFQDMKDLRVMEFTNLRGALSMPSSTQLCLENLETLCLHNCSLDDISMIGELKPGLQILSFRGSDVRKLPKQLGELTALKMLDLSDCKELTTIEPGVLGSLTNLEELNMENSFKDWEIDQGYDARPPNARLIELRNMSRLSNVKIHIPSTSMLPKDGQLFLNKLTFYKIMLGDVWDWDNDDKRPYRNGSKVLMLQFDDSPNVLQLDWVQATLQRTEVLSLRGSLDGKCESIDELCVKGFECLKHLDVKDCLSIRYIDSSNSGSNIFSDLESLFLEDLRNLEKVCNRETFSSKLKVIKVKYCNKLTHLFNFSVLNCNSELEEIIIESCEEIHCIVIDEDDKNDDAVKLLKLKTLKLNWLPKFQAFCVPEGLQPPMNALFSGRKVAFSCLESLVIDELDELENIWHPTDPPTELGKLRSLSVRYCKKLVRVINSNVLMKLLQHLESLTIGDCESIEHVFDVETHDDAISYSSLKELTIWDCPQLRTFGHYLPSEQDSVADNLSFFSQKEIFPCLESLDFYGLENVGEIWPDEVPPQTSFNMLKQVTIDSCRALSVVFPSTIIARLDNLTDIHVEGCDEMRQIIKIDERDKEATKKEMTFTFPCLTILVLKSLPELVTVYSLVETHYDAVSFSSLKEMKIVNCPQLRTFGQYLSPRQDYVTDDLSFFSQKVAFSCLESLVIDELDELENIWHPTDPPTELGKLRSLSVRYCKKLVRVINSNVLMKLLQHLESLTIGDCESIEHVFDVETHDDAISYSSLKELTIWDCPQLRTFGHYLPSEQDSVADNLSFFSQKEIFPCLESLDFYGLENVGEIWPDEVPPQTSFNMLKQVTIDSCRALSVVFPSTIIARLDNLTDIHVEGCDEMRQIIKIDERDKEATKKEMTFTFPCLTILVLKSLPELVTVYSLVETHYDAVSFSSLKEMKIVNCPQLRTFGQYLSPRQDYVTDDLSFFSQKVAFSCLESLVIDELDELENIWHPTDPPTELGKLRSLSVRYCKKLVRVINSNVLMKLLQHLESLTIGDCESIEHVFDVETHDDAISYSSLKELTIWDCPQLRTFGHYLPSEQDSVADNLSFFSQKEIFPCLESLDFYGLENVGEIWPDEVPPQTSFNMLKQVTIDSCRALSVVFPSTIIARLDNLTDIHVEGCDEMRQIIKIDERDKEATKKEMTFTFPCLTILVLKSLPELVTVYSLVETHYDAVSFSSLKEMKIVNCPQLRTFSQYLSPRQDYVTDDLSFFSQKVAFPCLESLVIYGLDELEYIWHPTHPPTELGKLRSLDVGSCDKLVRVINSNVLMKLLQHLESLSIYNCASIEHVFDVKEIVPCLEIDHLHHLKENNGGEGEEEEGRRRGDIHREMLTFNHLKELTLEWLRNLESFSSSSSVDLNFPSLEKLTIGRCRNMRTFSKGGILTTPKLHQVNWDRWNDVDQSQLTEDLNTTIQKKYAAEHVFS